VRQSLAGIVVGEKSRCILTDRSERRNRPISNPALRAARDNFRDNCGDNVYLVPFVEAEHTVFLKTIIPSRKATKQYLGEESDDEA
jgi:hypothetical protein